ncbi:MAG: hypothetical protein JWO71_1740 [Candidatus Acidoferrum typicum]|nr:hypothetical protein [Candidatus Acidoferrum typicum]
MEPISRAPSQRLFLVLIALFVSMASGRACAAQQHVLANLPDAPTPKEPLDEPQQKAATSRPTTTYDILSRRSFFFPDLAYTTRPLSSGQKFLLAADESAAPSALIVAAMSAGITQARNSWPGYGQGWNAYGKRYGATLALNASTDMFGTFLLPSVLHHDPRYFVLSHGTFSQKVGHALKSVLVTRTDSGGRAPNISGILGPLGAEGLANTYLPDAERSAGQTFERFGIQIAVIAAGNVAKEFWPAIFKTLRVGKVMPGASPDARSDSARQ